MHVHGVIYIHVRQEVGTREKRNENMIVDKRNKDKYENDKEI